MRLLLFGLSLFVLLIGGSFSLHAQTNVAAAHGLISFLTPPEQEQYASARAKALAAHPEIKIEGQSLMQQGKDVMANGTMADKQAFMEKMNSHRQKLRAAMLQVDPTLEPIFAKIDKHISEIKAKRADESQNAPGATNAPPAGQ